MEKKLANNSREISPFPFFDSIRGEIKRRRRGTRILSKSGTEFYNVQNSHAPPLIIRFNYSRGRGGKRRREVFRSMDNRPFNPLISSETVDDDHKEAGEEGSGERVSARRETVRG